MSLSKQIENEAVWLPPIQQQQVLDFVRALQRDLKDEEETWGEVGRELMAKVLEPEDFTDWEKSGQ